MRPRGDAAAGSPPQTPPESPSRPHPLLSVVHGQDLPLLPPPQESPCPPKATLVEELALQMVPACTFI